MRITLTNETRQESTYQNREAVQTNRAGSKQDVGNVADKITRAPKKPKI
jgi:hypothetical protein